MQRSRRNAITSTSVSKRVRGRSLTKISSWEMVCLVFAICVAAAVVCSAQLTTLHSFSGSNGSSRSSAPIPSSHATEEVTL